MEDEVFRDVETGFLLDSLNKSLIQVIDQVTISSAMAPHHLPPDGKVCQGAISPTQVDKCLSLPFAHHYNITAPYSLVVPTLDNAIGTKELVVFDEDMKLGDLVSIMDGDDCIMDIGLEFVAPKK